MSNFFLGSAIFLMLVGFGIYILARGQKALKAQLDGRLTELLAVTKELAKAQGIAIGRSEIEAERNNK